VIKVSVLGLKTSLILSPLAEITIPPFRRICAEFGALTISEMTYAKGIIYKDPKSLRRITRAETEEKYGIQLLTNSPIDLMSTIEIIESEKLSDFIELNLGCPKPKITNAKLGAALLRTKYHGLLKELMEVGSDSSKLPFTLKIRAGFDSITFNDILKIAEKTNVSFITLHARLATDTYKTPAKSDFWKQAVSSSRVPIIANGDVKSYDHAHQIIEQYGVVGVAIGRSARGNPQIFQKQARLLSREVYDRLIQYMKNTEYFNLFNLRVQSADFMKHFPYAANARKNILSMNNLDEIIEYTREMLGRK
jgi:tRNA-dihydrouridine synthase B